MDKAIRDRFTKAIEKADAVRLTVRPNSSIGDSASAGLLAEWSTQSLTLLKSMFADAHPYVAGFVDATASPYLDSRKLDRGKGVLIAAQDDFLNGHLWTLRERVHADVFDDFLEMAGSLVGEGYKDAAAVIAGSTLEEHLRKLAGKHTVDTTEQKRDGSVVPKKAATINDELKKAVAYNQLQASQVKAWLDLRNNAAHGKYGEYTLEQVEQMIDGIRGFFLRNPA